MSLNRRTFLQNLGALAGALSVGLTVFKPQQGKKVLFHTKPSTINRLLVGYRGDQFLTAGYVYAPYIPLYCTGDIVKPNVRLTRTRNVIQLS
jgi:hypothetical protein